MSTPREQLLDLLTDEVLRGLSTDELQQMKVLRGTQDELTEHEFDATMAALTLAAEADAATRSPGMPAELAARILATAPVQDVSGQVITLPARKPVWRSAVTGWWAAAACAVLAVWGWWPRLMPQPVEAPPQVAHLTPAQEREQLLSSGRAIQASWQPGNDPASSALQGDVVFDPVSQRGYLRFRGIPANDPRLSQYQLWIADGSRTQPQPVDGGVFDVSDNVNAPQATPEGDVIIPFEARLQIGRPAAFVVTVEQPGGVVVSSQERVLALATVTF